MPVLEAALYARIPTEDLQRLLVGESQQGSNLGPFFKWTGALRSAFAHAESYNEAAGRWGAVSRRLMVACLRNKNVSSLKVSKCCNTVQDQPVCNRLFTKTVAGLRANHHCLCK